MRSGGIGVGGLGDSGGGVHPVDSGGSTISASFCDASAGAPLLSFSFLYY